MKGKDRIKAKIQALMAKTTANGASQEEALSAIAKAQELMKQHMIDESDLNNPYLSEKCVTKFCSRFKSSYDLTIVFSSLCDAFDCEHYYTNEKVAFFGFEEDVDLCVYFYAFIIKACMNAKERYKKSDHYHDCTRQLGIHGRTLAASFIKGFQIVVCKKLNNLYKERMSQYSKEVGYGLVVIEKRKRVKDEFKIESPSLEICRNNLEVGCEEAYSEGVEKGLKINIIQGVSEAKSSNIKQLT